MNRRQRKMAKAVTGILGLCIIGYIVGPPLFWHSNKGIAVANSLLVSCPPCICDCSSQPLLSIPVELSIHTFLDCMKHDQETSAEAERSFTKLLTEEVKLREARAMEDESRADRALLEAKKMASQYQKEADKCSMGMETCEMAREKSEEVLDEQRRLSYMWELRAHQRGWKHAAAAMRAHAI